MAYATVVSVLHKMESNSNNVNLNIQDEICYLESFLTRSTPFTCRKMLLDGVDQHIQDLVQKFEDLMEAHLSSSLDRFVSDEDDGFVVELQKVKQDISSFTTKLKEKETSGGMKLQLHDCLSMEELKAVSPSPRLMGLDGEIERLVGWLYGGSYYPLRTISVFGMVGIGKTTLVQQVYGLPSISDRYPIRIMVRVGPDYNFRQLMLLVLDQLGFPIDDQDGDDVQEHLLQVLKGKRYLIVLDDVWSNEVCEDWKQAFPDDRTGSLILLTTTLADVAHHKSEYAHEKQFLTDEDSWNLIREMVFTDPEETCTLELERIGKKIAENCEGLPLLVIAIGELLLKVERTVECWTRISEDDNPLNIGVDYSTPISKSIMLSYEMLLYDLQVCFLHIGLFPRYYKIFAANLVKLWVAEGFCRLQGDESLEEAAENCLHELVSKSVVLISKSSSRMQDIKVCRVHTVFRNLCIGEAQKKRFCYVMKKYSYSFPQGTNRQQRLCIHNHVMLGLKEVQSTMESIPFLRSLLCFGHQHGHPIRVYLSFRLLRILDALRIRFYKFPNQVVNLLRLRYLSITYDRQLPGSLSKLQNLEVLIVDRCHRIKSLNAPSYLPVEIWSLKSLRHLRCMGIDMPDPSSNYGAVLEHLLTLSGVSGRSCTQRILERIPNLKKLGIQIELAPNEVETLDFFHNVAQHLHCLESFKCDVLGLNSQVVSTTPAFPDTLKKLALSGCGFEWKDMTAISMLPGLEILKLRSCAFRGPVWNVCEDEFLNLEFLLLEDLDIVKWGADYDSFPRLRRIVVRHCYKLDGIPQFGAPFVLETMEVDDCSTSASNSAEWIKEELLECKYAWQEFLITKSWEENHKMQDSASPKRFIYGA